MARYTKSIPSPSQTSIPLVWRAQFPVVVKREYAGHAQPQALSLLICGTPLILCPWNVPEAAGILPIQACKCQNIPPAEIYLKPPHFCAQGRRQKHLLPAFPVGLIMQNHT